ncbi:alpha/beta fold hydrolase [Streptacidiphilus neutrinimicus]|uniref:alpha/beta fold hydrolase n=1 Tax=Streptacidiphilus neutrinimicus TaxID=105420 RepID=UPI0005A8FC5E|nr:alpha/beta fold hydrolase [Streptacidiphilus neutrinimicus]
MRLFCLPHAGGTSRVFKPWPEFLGEDVELVALDVAGRGTRTGEEGPRSFADAADDLARIVAERCVGDDYALYGHSMGALLAYETAHRLAERGCPAPALLFAAACRPPGYRRPGPMLHSFPDAAFLGALAAFGGLPVEILHDRELTEFYAGLVRDDYRLYEQHAAVVTPRPLACPVSVVLGTEDPIAPVAAAEGWRAVSGGPLALLALEGAGHFFDDRIEEIGAFVATSLDTLRAPQGRTPAAEPLGRERRRPVHTPSRAARTPDDRGEDPVTGAEQEAEAAAELLGRLRLADVRMSVTAAGLGYDAPAGVLDDALLGQMARHKAALTALVAEGGPVEASGPMAWGQRRSFGRLEATTEPASFTIAMALSITGALDVPALQRALTLLTARHAGLRTRLVRRGGHLVQEVLPTARIPLPITDLTGVSPEDRDAAVDAWRREGARVPFPLGEGPLLRAALAEIGPEDWDLLVLVQHTVSDAWSNSTMLRDLDELYRGGLPEPTRADLLGFARWESEHYRGPRLDALRAWWTDLLADAPLTYALPSDRPRPVQLSGRGGLHEFLVPARLADQVRAFADTAGATEFAVLFAAFLEWLGGLTGQADLTVPVNFANRPRSEYEEVVGFFVDNVAVRIALDDAEPFAALVRRAGAALFENVDRFVPFGLLGEMLREAGKDGLGVFPQVPFVVLNTPPMQPALGDLDVALTLVPTGGAKMEFSFILEPEDGGWHGFVPYQSDMFDAATLAGWCAGYGELLERRTAGVTER